MGGAGLGSGDALGVAEGVLLLALTMLAEHTTPGVAIGQAPHDALIGRQKGGRFRALHEVEVGMLGGHGWRRTPCRGRMPNLCAADASAAAAAGHRGLDDLAPRGAPQRQRELSSGHQ